MRIHSNAIALNAYRNWTMHNDRMANALARISSGNRINRAADDSAGMAIGEKMKMKLRMLEVDQDTVVSSMSMLETADGSLNQIEEMLNRMLELAQRSSTETMSDADRHNLNTEYQQLMDEINRTARGSKFNSMSLLQPDEAAEAGTVKENEPLAGLTETTAFQGENINAFLDGLDHLLNSISGAAKAGDSEALLSLGIDRSNGKTDAENLRSAITNFTIENAEKLLNSPSKAEGSKKGTYTINISDGAITVDMPSVDLDSLSLTGTDLLTSEHAGAAADALKNAIKSVASSRGDIGAAYNRLEYTRSNLERMEANLTDALSRITDADMAKEIMIYTKEKLLTQVSEFVMAQANQKPDGVLAMLKSL